MAKERWPTFEPHVGLFQPDEEMLKKWEHPILFPTYELGKGFGMCESLQCLATVRERCAWGADSEFFLRQMPMRRKQVTKYNLC